MVRPCRVRTIVVGPRRATTRTVSAAIASSRSSPATSRPSDLLTTLLVTTTTSPSDRSTRGSSRSARSSPGRTSGTPSGAVTEMLTCRRPARSRRRPSRRWPPWSRHQQRDGRGGQSGGVQPVQVAGVLLVDEPAVQDAAVRAGAVVQADAGRAHLDADRGEHLLGHPADVGAADDGGEPDHRRPRRDHGLAHPGHAEDGADGDHRVGRRQHDQVGVGDRVDDPGSGCGVVQTDHDHRLGGHRRRAA